MKSFFISVLIYIAFVSAVKAVEVRCKVIKCLDIEKPVNTNSWCEPVPSYSIKNFSVQASNANENGIITVDTNDGDQIEEATFKKSDVLNLKESKVSTIEAHFRDGYYWDQEYTRFILTLACSLK